MRPGKNELQQSEAARAQLEKEALESQQGFETLEREVSQFQFLVTENEGMASTIARQEERLQEQAKLLERYYTEERQSRSKKSATPSEIGLPKRRRRGPKKAKVDDQAVPMLDQRMNDEQMEVL